MSDQLGLFGGDPPPPFVPNSATSAEAALLIEPAAGTLRAEVLAFLRACGAIGATDEEMQECIPMMASTQRPRRVELVDRALVRDSGHHRHTRSGRKAVVWVAT